MMKRTALALTASLLLSLSVSGQAQTAPLTVLAATTIIADVAQTIGGDLVAVTALIPPDSDIHAFQPAPADVVRASEADLILVNGAGLEAFLGDLLQDVPQERVIVVSNGIAILSSDHDHDHDHEHEADATAEADHDHDHDHADATAEATADADHDHDHEVHMHEGGEYVGVLGEDADCGDLLAGHDDHAHDGEATAEADSTAESDDHAHEGDEDAHDHDHGSCDPHVWTDPHNVKVWATNIAEAFAAADPANAETYRANAEAYHAALDALDAEVRALIDTIPAERRVIVTNHEFLRYFALHYGFEIVGTVIPGGTTLAEPAPQDLAALIEVINDEGVSAIFIEASDAGALANVVAQEAGRPILVATLYSDSLSAAEGPAGTYLAYLRTNAQTMVDALR